MKIKNKETGEIVYATMMASYGGGELQIRYYPVNNAENTHFKEYRSISELNEEWEDAPEEPKEYWFIDEFGLVQKEIEYYYKDNKEAVHDKRITVGNYFETKEEAEKAVEKLKAWKRLKDKGIVIRKLRHNENGGEMYWSCPSKTGISDKQIWLDLDLLFSGDGE